jgi:hypothetical protein
MDAVGIDICDDRIRFLVPELVPHRYAHRLVLRKTCLWII